MLRTPLGGGHTTSFRRAGEPVCIRPPSGGRTCATLTKTPNTKRPKMHHQTPNLNDSRAGFTLIELMVVIVILGILAGLIVPRIMGRPEEAKQLKAKLQIESFETALKLYKLDNGTYPTTDQGLQALIEEPESGPQAKKWRRGGYLEKGRLPQDPWGSNFIYLSPGVHDDFDITSYGADGIPGGEDTNQDINSWEIE